MEQKQIIDGRFIILHTEQTGSTNSDLVNFIKSEEWDKEKKQFIYVLVADYQTQGRGRLDRIWQTKRGEALLVSLLIWHKVESQHSISHHHINMCLSLGAREAIQGYCPVSDCVKIKWPNDLVIAMGDEESVDYKKIGGILGESFNGEALVLGLGVNLETPELKDDHKEKKKGSEKGKDNVKGIAPVGISQLQNKKDKMPDRWELLEEILKSFSSRYDKLISSNSKAKSNSSKGLLNETSREFNNQATSEIKDEIEKHLAYLNTQVDVLLPNDKHLSGTISGIDRGGRLLLQTKDSIVEIETGDILKLRGQ